MGIFPTALTAKSLPIPFCQLIVQRNQWFSSVTARHCHSPATPAPSLTAKISLPFIRGEIGSRRVWQLSVVLFLFSLRKDHP